MSELTELQSRLLALGGSFIAVNEDAVNIDDLLRSGHPGAIVRVIGSPANALQVVQFDNAPLGVVAGWISEEE